jgi:predicted PurR-regulated permease PerM
VNLQTTAFIGLLIAVTLAFFGLLADFFQPVFWAATLAVVFNPLCLYMQRLVKGRNTLAAGLTLLVICITVVIPFWVMTTAVITEAANLYTKVQAGNVGIEEVINWAQLKLPLVFDLFDRAGLTQEEIKGGLSSSALTASQFIGSWALSIGQDAVRFTAMFLLMLYVLFFFLRDGETLIECLIYALPLGDVRERALLDKFAEVSRATVRGTLVIGLVQGAMGGLLFWSLNIEAAIFWGAIMVVMSLLPVVGASLIWGPAAIWFAVNGDYVSATILVVIGALIIGCIDYVLRPLLVGRDTRMPDYLVLLSTLGGLTMFGVSGFVIGPVIAALFLTVWVMFAKEFNNTEGAALYEGQGVDGSQELTEASPGDSSSGD